MVDKKNLISLQQEQSFNKGLNINNKSYEIKLHLDLNTSFMKFYVIDKTDP